METKLKNLKVYLEESIMQKGREATAGSAILKGFISPFDAAVAERLNAANIDIAGRVPMDEFGALKLTGPGPEKAERCADEARGCAGDATGGPDQTAAAVETVLADQTAAVLCNDLFGKIRRQAAANGLFFLQPSYGTVSRYGLIPSASSMDCIGILCADPGAGFSLLAKLAGKDIRDGAMYPDAAYNYDKDRYPHGGDHHFTANNEHHSPASPDHRPGLRLMVPDNIWGLKNGANNSAAVPEPVRRFDIIAGELKYFEVFRQVLYILSCAEICNNTNRYDGVKFGYRAADYKSIGDLYVRSRSEALGCDMKLTIIMGAMVLAQDNYEPLYEKAMKIRRLIKESLRFNDYDLIALPAGLGQTPYEASALSALTALAGLPSLTVPGPEVGIQLFADSKREDLLDHAWAVIR